MKESILICAVPYVETVEPIMAPGLLKSILNSRGIKSQALDLNIKVVNKVNAHPKKQQLLDFFFSQRVDPDAITDIVELVDFCKDTILAYKPTVLSLSLLIYSCQTFTHWLCAALKNEAPNLKIVIGGTGIRNFIGDSNLNFCTTLQTRGLIDDYIVGDGDVSFYEFIKGNKDYPGINSPAWQPVPDLNCIPWPDYSDYNFDEYEKPLIPLCDSRGCVKNCEFCDVIEYWSKYQYRLAENIFSEMLYQINTVGRTQFSFRSSLINGNLREFKKLINLISEYNADKPKELQITWEGYFIVRGAEHHTEELWKKISESNGTLLVGVESLVSSVRHKLGKTFKDDDIEHDLQMGKKYQVPLILLIIVAYPTETLTDFEYTKQWFRAHADYANNSVVFVSLSFASILPGTQLSRRSDEYSIKKGKLPSIWINQNLNITSAERKQYLIDLYDICVSCGFNAGTNIQTLEHTDDQAF